MIHHHFTTIDSTNNYALELLKSIDNSQEILITADYQSSGRGQRGNTWHSNNKENIIFSLIYFPKNLLAHSQFKLSMASSLAIIDYLKEKQIKDCFIKWPNDIYIGMRKVCGMLIENMITGKNIRASVIGIGLNLNQKTFGNDVKNPISLQEITNQEYQIEKERELLISKLLLRLDNLDYQNLKEEYFENLISVKEPQNYLKGDYRFAGSIKNIDDLGHLYLKNEDTGKIEKFDFKEVEMIV